MLLISFLNILIPQIFDAYRFRRSLKVTGLTKVDVTCNQVMKGNRTWNSPATVLLMKFVADILPCGLCNFTNSSVSVSVLLIEGVSRDFFKRVHTLSQLIFLDPKCAVVHMQPANVEVRSFVGPIIEGNFSVGVFPVPVP